MTVAVAPDTTAPAGGSLLRSGPLALAALGVLGQVAYPLVGGAVRDGLTVATVLLFFAALLADAPSLRSAGSLVALAGAAYAIELIGVHTGWPFGHYRYGGGLGPAPGGVPVVVALAWATMAAAETRCARARWPQARTAVAAAAWTLVGWDLFLDPQMVAAGHWTWADPHPGWYGVPLTNVAGWIVVAVLLCAAFHATVRTDGKQRLPIVPAVIVLWTYFAEVVGNLIFFGRPFLGVVGAVVMGITVIPLTMSPETKSTLAVSIARQR